MPENVQKANARRWESDEKGYAVASCKPWKPGLLSQDPRPALCCWDTALGCHVLAKSISWTTASLPWADLLSAWTSSDVLYSINWLNGFQLRGFCTLQSWPSTRCSSKRIYLAAMDFMNRYLVLNPLSSPRWAVISFIVGENNSRKKSLFFFP